MQKLGISVYTGLGQSFEQNVSFLKLARQCGYSELFTSMHIPESDPASTALETRRLLLQAGELGFGVTADVSPRSWEVFGFKPTELKAMGISQLRIDFGLHPRQMLELIEETGLGIQINASTTRAADLADIIAIGLRPEFLSAGHNYYPRPETGLSYELFIQRSAVFVSAGIPVSAFIPGKKNPRGPIFAGLPTVESHRCMSPLQAAKQFAASGLLHSLIFSDPLVLEKDLLALAELPRVYPETLPLRVKLRSGLQNIKPIVLGSEHTNRIDAAASAIRSQHARALCKEIVFPQYTLARRRGDVTLDNLDYARYMGELQIVLKDMPADARVNVIGRIIDEDLCYLDCLTPGRKFCLWEVETE